VNFDPFFQNFYLSDFVCAEVLRQPVAADDEPLAEDHGGQPMDQGIQQKRDRFIKHKLKLDSYYILNVKTGYCVTNFKLL
jgi:hypothetical protein